MINGHESSIFKAHAMAKSPQVLSTVATEWYDVPVASERPHDPQVLQLESIRIDLFGIAIDAAATFIKLHFHKINRTLKKTTEPLII